MPKWSNCALSVKSMKFCPNLFEGMYDSKKIGAQKIVEFFTFLKHLQVGCNTSIFANIGKRIILKTLSNLWIWYFFHLKVHGFVDGSQEHS